ncbi:oxidoreductase, short chain dehydrogenase/reductase family [gamma proteobacterium HdN1]|nr:oxidoreductase, short chain dehydrogenase/reductase family [gamma proteobacterium HdN1]
MSAATSLESIAPADPARFALITGAGRRLGATLCRYWLAQGWQVIGHYRTETAEVSALRALGATMLQADFERPDEVAGMVEQLTTQLPWLDLIVHNASSFSPDVDDLERNLAAMDGFFQVHMKAPYAINLGLHDLLLATPRTSADIIHITDIFADRPDARYAAYCASKAGLANLSLSFAKRFAPKIKVNAIQPGPIKFLDSHADENRVAILRETLLGREGGFEPVVQMIAALVANPFVTGAAYKVDGGRSLS